jgi:F-type H+-transporting ATPase subunit a
MQMISIFALDEAGPIVHIAPKTDFTISGWPVTNSMFYGWIILLMMMIGLPLLAHRLTVRPKKGFGQYVESGVEFASNVVTSSFNDKSVGRKYVPFFVTLFFVVLINNWSGLIPIVGEGVQTHDHPLLRPWTGDLNTTIAMGLVTMVFVYAASIREIGGIRKYLRHFFIGSPLNPLYFVIGLIEMVTDLTRALSLALRLFLNVTIGEIVIAVFAYLGSAISPADVLAPITALPFTLLELGVGALQAYIFVVLGVNYLAISVNSAHDHDKDDLTEDVAAETIDRTTSRPAGASGVAS